MTARAPAETKVPLEVEHERRLLRQMLLVREFEDRCAELYSAGTIRGFVHLYVGEEAVAAGVFDALDPDANVVATYREHAHALLKGVPTRAAMAEMFGKQEGCSGGRGGSMHLFDAAHRFYGGNAIVGGGIPLAVGLALAEKLRGSGRVTACFLGDGAVAEGIFHESVNLAVLWQLPVLFCCENNLYAMGTGVERALSETDLAAKARAYRLPAEAVDGMDVLAVADATAKALAAMKQDGGPRFLEFRTYRFRAHSMYDPDRYRDKAEVERWRQRDPITAFAASLEARGVLPAERRERLEREVKREVQDAIDFAAAGTLEPVADLERFVTSEVTT